VYCVGLIVSIGSVLRTIMINISQQLTGEERRTKLVYPICENSMKEVALHIPGLVKQWECHSCGKVVVETYFRDLKLGLGRLNLQKR